MMRSFLLFIVLFSFPVFGQSPQTVGKNNKAIDSYQSEQYYEAYKLFNESLAEEPFHPLLHLNLGMAFHVNEESEKALQAFVVASELAARSGNKEFQYFSLFDLGTAKAMAGDIPEALVNFQKALALKPGDKDVRENIEKMWQSQGGKGKGDNSSDQKQKSDEQQDGENPQEPKDQKDKGQGEDQKKQKPKPFKSKDLTKDDVRKILEEIKNQEQKIRAEVYEGKGKSKPRDKDW